MPLEFKNLEKRYGRKVVFSNASCHLPVGLNLLTGPSGAGKSTLLRVLASAEKVSQGTIAWQGEPFPQARKAFRRSLGYSPGFSRRARTGCPQYC